MFLTFALITLCAALGMLLQKNVIVAGLCLVATFFGLAGLFLLLANPVAAAFQQLALRVARPMGVAVTVIMPGSRAARVRPR